MTWQDCRVWTVDDDASPDVWHRAIRSCSVFGRSIPRECPRKTSNFGVDRGPSRRFGHAATRSDREPPSGTHRPSLPARAGKTFERYTYRNSGFDLHQRQRSSLEIIMFAFGDQRCVRRDDVLGGIQYELPLDIVWRWRKTELNRFMMRVDQHQEGVVENGVAQMVFFFDAIAGESDAQASDVGLLPILFGHFMPIRSKPGQVFNVGAVDAAALEKLPAAEHRMVAPQGDHVAREVAQLLVDVLPIEPRDLVVLAVCVVVPALRAADLVAAEQHRHTLGEQQHRDEVALLPMAQAQHLRVVGGSFCATVP